MNSEEIKSLYASGLKKLIFENKNSINALAQLAAEYQTYAAEVVSTIEEYIGKVDAKIKLCMLDLIDCIIQKVGGAYVELFSENISIVFCRIFKAVDPDSRIKMYNMRQIWSNIFPAEKLYEIDFKANLLDPTWPMTVQNPYLVHVNPKCLPEYSLLRIQDELLEKEKALLEVQEKKLQIEVLKVQIKLGRLVSYTPCQTIIEPTTAQYDETQESTSPLHTSSNKERENKNTQVPDENFNNENVENVGKFNKNRLKLHERPETFFTLDTDGMYGNEYHIKPPIYEESNAPPEIVRVGGNSGRNRRDQDWLSPMSPISQEDNSDFISFETEDLTNYDTSLSDVAEDVSERNGRSWSHSSSWNTFKRRNHFGRGGNGFRFSNYQNWKNNRWNNRRGRFPGRFQHVKQKFRNLVNVHYSNNLSRKRKSDDFDRDCDADLRNKLQCSNSNKELTCLTNPTITKSKASAEKINPEPAVNPAAAATQPQPPRPQQQKPKTIENDLDITALDIERELARMEEVFCLLEERPESPAKSLRETNDVKEEEEEEEEGDTDSCFSEIYNVVESTGSSEMDEIEERDLGKSARDNLEAFPTPPREANPTGFISSIDGNNECKPFTGSTKKIHINFKRLDKNKKSVPFIQN